MGCSWCGVAFTDKEITGQFTIIKLKDNKFAHAGCHATIQNRVDNGVCGLCNDNPITGDDVCCEKCTASGKIMFPIKR